MSLYARSPPILTAEAAGICRSTSPAERGDALVELGLWRRLVLLDDLALRVSGRRRRGQVDRGLVLLRQPHELLRLLGEGAEQDEEQARGEGVERAGVPGPRAGPVAEIADDRERGRAGRLVDEHQAARGQPSLRRHSSPL